ncbi:MAG TPA: MFS transporter [Pelomicrobium sp.]|nr:MFS transporter [Pelomicrobium sp.]
MTLARRDLLAYGALGLPLAMAALPVYVHAPKYYGDTLGVNLAAMGIILLALRIVDAVQDPWLGHLSDRYAARPHGRLFFVMLAVPLLALGFYALFNPPAGVDLTLWFAGTLFVVYLAFSLANISYQALGAELSRDPHQRTRVTATREGLALVGVLIAAAAPELLKRDGESGLPLFSLLFIPLLLIASHVTLGGTPRPVTSAPSDTTVFGSLRLALANRRFRHLLAVFVLGGVAASIPATLVLFFVDDVLGAENMAGAFLAVYFLAGAAGMLFWVRLAKAIGKKNAWFASMVLAIVAFVWAFTLGRGDTTAFLVICALSGLALGADLAIPPSILADVIDWGRGGAGPAQEGGYFGLWSLVTKLNLALAAGIALPLLPLAGYQPGGANDATALTALAAAYALIPCVLKALAAALLMAAPLAPAPASAPATHGG